MALHVRTITPKPSLAPKRMLTAERGLAPRRTLPAVTLALVALALVLALVISACSSGESSDSGDTPDAPPTTRAGVPGASGSIVVSAAASLTEAFTTIRDEFVGQNPDATVTVNFGSSGALAEQIRSGAPADVAAFADSIAMDGLEQAGLLDGAAQIFAGNRLVIVTRPDNPTRIGGLEDLVDQGTISLCVETAPCGRYAAQLLVEAGLTVPASKISRGQDVKSTLTAATEGDADAAIVYATDAVAAGDAVDTVEIAGSEGLVAEYPIAILSSTASPELAQAFVAYVLSDAGQSTLLDAGFLTL